MSNEVLVKVEGVRKKFCRSLKKSLWYGLKDMAAEMAGGSHQHDQLRDSEFWAVNDVSFELKRGECLGLIGHNGAGKTTLLKMLNGLIKPDHGRIEMRGRVGALISLGAGFNPILTGRENIYVNGSVLGLTKREIDVKMDDIIDFAGIRDFIDTPTQSYSSGMQVRLGFAIASSCKPDILLLDEVLAVGDMAFQAKCFNRLGKIRRDGTGFILVAHNMHQITRFCEKVLYMKNGKVEFYGLTENGVGLFLKEMSNVSGEKNEPEMAGSLSVVIDKAFFSTDEIHPVLEIESGSSVKLVINYRCKNEVIVNPILEVILRDPSGEAFYHGSTDMSGVCLGHLQGEGILSVTFPNLPANNQELTASIMLWNSTMHDLICWRRGIKISIRGNPKSTGRTLIKCDWGNHADIKT